MSGAAASCHRRLVFFFLFFFKDSHFVGLSRRDSPHPGRPLMFCTLLLFTCRVSPLRNIVSARVWLSPSLCVFSCTQVFSLKPSVFSKLFFWSLLTADFFFIALDNALPLLLTDGFCPVFLSVIFRTNFIPGSTCRAGKLRCPAAISFSPLLTRDSSLSIVVKCHRRAKKKGTKWPFALSRTFCSLLSNVTHSNGNLSPLRQTPGEIGRRHKYELSHEYSCVKLGPLSFNLPLSSVRSALAVGFPALSSASSTVCHISLQPSFNDCAGGNKNSLLMPLEIRKTWNMQLLLMMQCWCL